MIKFINGDQEHRQPEVTWVELVSCATHVSKILKYQWSTSIPNTCLFVIYLKAVSYCEKKKETKKLTEPTAILLESN